MPVELLINPEVLKIDSPPQSPQDRRGHARVHEFPRRARAVRADPVLVGEMRRPERWHVGDRRQLVVPEVRRPYRSVLEREILGEGHAEAVDEATRELATEATGFDDPPGVDREDRVEHAHGAGRRVDGHFMAWARAPWSAAIASNVALTSIANAVHDASGARVRALPVTAERVWRELRGT